MTTLWLTENISSSSSDVSSATKPAPPLKSRFFRRNETFVSVQREGQQAQGNNDTPCDASDVYPQEIPSWCMGRAWLLLRKGRVRCVFWSGKGGTQKHRLGELKKAFRERGPSSFSSVALLCVVVVVVVGQFNKSQRRRLFTASSG